MHVFDELLNSRKLIGPNVPSYFTPLLMQDAKDQADPEPFPLFQPPVLQPVPPVDEFIQHGQPGGDTNNSGDGLAVQNGGYVPLEGVEGSDQEQDMTYGRADDDLQEDSGVPLSPLLLSPPHHLSSCRTRVTCSSTSGGLSQYPQQSRVE